MASKLLSLLSFGLSAAALFRFFGNRGALVALLLANASTLSIFSFSWSEGPFILVMVLFSISMSKVLESSETTIVQHLIIPILLSVMLFEIRYIGIFSVGVILAAAARNLHKSYKSSISLVAAAVSAAILFFAHIQLNIDRTSFPTGMERIPAPESNLDLIWDLFRAVMNEVILPVTSNDFGKMFWLGVALQGGLFIWLVIFALKRQKDTVRDTAATKARGFLLVGICYLMAIIVRRWRSQFDPFGFRLINPGILLLFVFLLNYVLLRRNWLMNKVFISLACLGLFSGAWTAREAVWRSNGPSYFEKTEARLDRYSELLPGTILVFGDEHLRYLRPDLFIVEPDYTPYFKTRERWDNFTSRLRPGLLVVIDALNTKPWRGYHTSILVFLSAQEKGSLVIVDDEVSAQIDALRRN
jgi:hypothetical protein